MQIQLDLIEPPQSKIEAQLSHMQSQISAMKDSMDRVRRRLFAQMSEIQKMCLLLQSENMDLKSKIDEKKKIDWIYGENGNLFETPRSQKEISIRTA